MMKIIAKKSEYPKCKRCWNHDPTCEHSFYWKDTLCKRCIGVLCELEEAGLWKPGQQHEWTDKAKKAFSKKIKIQGEMIIIKRNKNIKTRKYNNYKKTLVLIPGKRYK